MKSNQTDGATAIATPVRVYRSAEAGKCFLHDDNGGWLADCHSKHVEELAQAVNEHAALKEVAAAAQKVVETASYTASYQCSKSGLSEALSALAALRGGKGAQS